MLPTAYPCIVTPHTNQPQQDAFGQKKLPIWGGKDCEGVTVTPAHEEKLKIGNIGVTALHTPCHTQDSICWFMEDGEQKVVFTGDTLFISGELAVRSVAAWRQRTDGGNRLWEVFRGDGGTDEQGAKCCACGAA